MAGQQEPFPLASDEPMADALAGPGPAGPVRGSGSGMSSREQAAMADLEQALGLAAAWFGGDESAARWGRGDGDNSSDGSAPGSPAGVLPGGDPYNARGEGQQWEGDAAWQAADAEQDALLGLPGAQQAQHDDPLSLGVGSFDGLTGLDTGGSSLLDGPPLEAGADNSTVAGSASGPASLDAAGPSQRRGAASAAEASSVARDLGSMQLDDIDADPADEAAPGGCRLAACGCRGLLFAGGSGGAGSACAPTGPRFNCFGRHMQSDSGCLAFRSQPQRLLLVSSPASCATRPAGGGPLSLEAALAAGPAQSEPAPPPIEPAPTDLRAAEDDPLAALEAAVEADKPK